MLPLPLATFTAVSWAIVAGYFALTLFVGFAVSRGKQSTRDYFLAGRSLPTWALAVSIVATTLSAATFVGVPDQVYLGDVTYIATYIGGMMAVIIVGALFVPRLYRAGTITVYGYLQPRFGQTGVVAVSVAFLIGRLLASGSRLFFAAVPLTLMLFGTTDAEHHRGQLVLAIALVGAVGMFYTVMGGIRAVVWTDTIQLILVIGAAILTIVLLLQRIPIGVDQIWSVASQPGTGVGGGSKLTAIDTSFDFTKSYTIWACIFGIVWLNIANYGVDQDFAQRFMVSKSATRGALSVIASQMVTVVVVALFMAVGVLLYIFYRRPDLMGAGAPAYTPAGGLEPVYPNFLLRELSPVYAGLAIAGFFAVAQGSMDSAINAMASSAVADIWMPLRRRLGRVEDETASSATPMIAVLIIGVAMIGFAIMLALIYDPKNKTLLDFALGVMTFAFTGMLGVFLTALFTPRGNAASCIAALIAGAATIALLQQTRLAWTWQMPIGTAVAFAVCVAGRPAARGSDGAS